jgi:arabinofuranosyltransferase
VADPGSLRSVSETPSLERGVPIGRAWPWGLAAVAIALLAMGVARAWPFTVDDTYITLRYSRNVALGLGPTFNATGPRAEGYTTLLWMLLLAPPHALGLDAVAFAKGLGVAATFATLLVAARWARAEGRRVERADRGGTDRRAESRADGPDSGAWAGATAAICLAAIPATAVHAVSGMETALFTLLLTAMFATSAEVVHGRGRATNRLVVLALLIGLTRPEGNLAALVVIAATAVRLPLDSRPRLAFAAAVVWALPICAYELWRRSYYGLPFPLPFYVKLATPGHLPGWPDVRDWLRGPVLHFGPLLAAALLRPSRALVPAVIATLTLTAFFVLPQHQMGYDHRYLAPLDPTLGVLAGVGLARLAARARWPVAATSVAAVAAVVVAAGLEAADAGAVIAGEADYGRGLAEAHERLGRDLLALDMPAGRLVISDAGAVPYFSRWWTLDLIGLNEPTIATTARRDPAWVLAQQPDVVVLASPRTDRVEAWDWNPWEPALYDACLAAGFVRVELRRFADDYWLWVLARPGSVAGARLLAGR